MTVKSAPFFWAVCDCCGAEAEHDDYRPLFENETEAIDAAADCDYMRAGDDLLCPDCWCWPEDLPDYPGDDAWTGTDDSVRKPDCHDERKR